VFFIITKTALAPCWPADLRVEAEGAERVTGFAIGGSRGGGVDRHGGAGGHRMRGSTIWAVIRPTQTRTTSRNLLRSSGDRWEGGAQSITTRSQGWGGRAG